MRLHFLWVVLLLGALHAAQASFNAGIQVDDEVLVAYNDLIAKHEYSYLIFKIKRKAGIVIAKRGHPYVDGATDADSFERFQELKQALVDGGHPAYFVFDMILDEEAAWQGKKIAFGFWIPDTSSVSSQMLYASVRDNIRKPLAHIAFELQAHTPEDLDFRDLQQKISIAA